MLYRPWIFAAGGLLGFFGYNCVAGPIAISKPHEMVRLEAGFIGFNSPMGALGDPEGSYQSERMDQALATLPIQALRFPGGTVANYFDWDTGSLIEQALKKSGKNRLVENQEKKRAKNDGKLPPVDFGSFYSITEQHGIRRFVVLNLLSSPIDITIATIDRIKKQHPGRYYWELGNELSQEAYRKRAYATKRFNATVYADLAYRIAAHIERHYPEDRVGIVVSQLVEGRVPQTRRIDSLQRKRNAWDTAVASVDQADAVIIHPYVLVSSPFMARLNALAGDRPRIFAGMDERTEKRWRWMFASVQQLPEAYVQRLDKRFPGKKIWITEAGLIDDHDRDNPERQQDMSRLLFDIAYFASWLKYYPHWESFLYHGLFVSNGHMAAFGRDMRWNANTLAYAFLARLIRDGRAVAALAIDDVPVYLGTGLYGDTEVRSLTGVYVSKDNGDSILLVNTGPKPIEVKVPFDQMNTISAGGKYDAIMSGIEFDDAEKIPRVGGVHGLMVVEPFSVVLIEESRY